MFLKWFFLVTVSSSGTKTRWCIFIPTWGNDPIWLIFFQMGWFNHHLENFPLVYPCSFSTLVTQEVIKCRACYPWQHGKRANASAHTIIALGIGTKKCPALDWSAAGLMTRIFGNPILTILVWFDGESPMSIVFWVESSYGHATWGDVGKIWCLDYMF